MVITSIKDEGIHFEVASVISNLLDFLFNDHWFAYVEVIANYYLIVLGLASYGVNH